MPESNEWEEQGVEYGWRRYVHHCGTKVDVLVGSGAFPICPCCQRKEFDEHLARIEKSK